MMEKQLKNSILNNNDSSLGLSDSVFNGDVFKIVLSKPVKNNISIEGRVYIRTDIIRNGEKYQASMYTQKQVFHKNLNKENVKHFVDKLFGVSFLQYNAWDKQFEYSASISKKGKIFTSRRASSQRPHIERLVDGSFNKQKNYIIKEGESIPVLIDMGIFTKEGKICAPMRDKFHQINRFLEIISDETKFINNGESITINVIDFGCGKSYLTFVVYHYFTHICKLHVNICGLDLNTDVVEKCTESAIKYGYESIVFKIGDIGKQASPPSTI